MRTFRLTSGSYFKYELQEKCKFLWWNFWSDTGTYSDNAEVLRDIVRELGGIMVRE